MTNRDQKRQFDEAVRQIERIIGRKLGKDDFRDCSERYRMKGTIWKASFRWGSLCFRNRTAI